MKNFIEKSYIVTIVKKKLIALNAKMKKKYEYLKNNLKGETLKMKQKNLWLTVGTPGSGKSWFARNKFNELTKAKNTEIVSRDAIRFNLLDTLGGEYFDHEDTVWNNFVLSIKECLENPKITDVIADATHLSPKSRRKLLCNFDLSNINVNFIICSTSLDICLNRNSQRKGREYVPEEVLKSMYNSFIPPTEEELNTYCTKQIILVDESAATLLERND